MPALPTLKRAAVMPTGPRLYQLARKPQSTGPPGVPPPGFVTAKTSATEWPPYWGLQKIFGTPSPETVRDFPFMGGPPIWTYQAFAEAGSDRATNIDFVVWGPGGSARPIAIRVMTEFFHNFASNDVQIYDALQLDRLQRNYEVVDLFDYEYMRDPTGRAVIVRLKELIGLIQGPRPVSAGVVQRV